MTRLDHFIDIATAGRDVGIIELLGIFRDQLFAPLLRISCLLDLASKENIHRAFGTHDRDLGGGPGVVDIAAHVLAAHHIVSAAIGFARNHRDLGHRGLAIGVE